MSKKLLASDFASYSRPVLSQGQPDFTSFSGSKRAIFRKKLNLYSKCKMTNGSTGYNLIKDFSTSMTKPIGIPIFIHEMVHVWQKHNGVLNPIMSAIGNSIRHGFLNMQIQAVSTIVLQSTLIYPRQLYISAL